MINSHFMSLFEAIRPNRIGEALDNMESKVSQEFNDFLAFPFAKGETKEALF